jgi:hypothetical protein
MSMEQILVRVPRPPADPRTAAIPRGLPALHELHCRPLPAFRHDEVVCPFGGSLALLPLSPAWRSVYVVLWFDTEDFEPASMCHARRERPRAGGVRQRSRSSVKGALEPGTPT